MAAAGCTNAEVENVVEGRQTPWCPQKVLARRRRLTPCLAGSRGDNLVQRRYELVELRG